ncbi:hypothetical protein J6590_101430 [Homalodisca vitripennis]|nr:hypothetical protein J6590_008952 [Homalodisca vitripennis]KAG8274730.1 hypothetical protein J6590_101430 [Homalodisca vitripennis]
MLNLELQSVSGKNMQEKNVSSNNLLMCRQWWKVCWVYGDQEKYYRQLYGRRHAPSATVVTVQREVSALHHDAADKADFHIEKQSERMQSAGEGASRWFSRLIVVQVVSRSVGSLMFSRL